MELLEIDEIQARAILDMQLRKLAALERQELIDEYDELTAKIADYEAILASPERQRQIVGDELGEIVAKYGDDRRTEIIAFDGDVTDEDLIAEEDVVVTITRGGYAKRTKTDQYRAQRRGGKGVRGAQLRTDDIVDHFFVTTTHHWILFFTNKGRVYRAKAYELPDAGRDARGQHVANLLAFQPDEQIAEVLALRDYKVAPYLVLATKRRAGEEDPAHRLRLAAFRRHHRDQPARGRRGHRGPARLARGGPAAGQPRAQAIRFNADRRGAAPDGPGHLGRDRHAVQRRRRTARHVRCPRGRRRPRRDRRRLRQAHASRPVPGPGPGRPRRGHGADRRGSRGELVGALMVQPEDEVFAITSGGGVIRTRAGEVKLSGRQTMGVRLMNLASGDSVVAIARNAEALARPRETEAEIEVEADAETGAELPETGTEQPEGEAEAEPGS